MSVRSTESRRISSLLRERRVSGAAMVAVLSVLLRSSGLGMSAVLPHMPLSSGQGWVGQPG